MRGGPGSMHRRAWARHEATYEAACRQHEQITPVPVGEGLEFSPPTPSTSTPSSPSAPSTSTSMPPTTSPSSASSTATSSAIPRVRARQRVDCLARQLDLMLALQLSERLDRRWFMSRLRGQLPDGDREQAKLLRTMRGVRLLLFWRRPR